MARQVKSDVASSAIRLSAAPGSDNNHPGGEVFEFDPAALVRGIVFHLLDEHMAVGVSGDSVRVTVERLTSAGVHPAVRKSLWTGLSNKARLRWLLAESRTTHTIAPDRTAVLAAAQN